MVSPMLSLYSLAQCSLDKIDPYLSVLVREQIENSGSTEPLSVKFENMITENTCITSGGVRLESQWWTTEDDCKNFGGFCLLLGQIFGGPFYGVPLTEGMPIGRKSG